MAGLGTIYVELSLDDKVFRQKLSEELSSTQATANGIERVWKALGVKNDAQFDAERRVYQNSMALIKKSVTATQADIIRAQEVTNAKLKALNEQQFGHQTTMLEGLKKNWLAASIAIGAAMATANQAWGLIKLGAEYSEQKTILDNLSRKYKTTADDLVSAMAKASEGLVANSDLMQIALGGIGKGMNPDQMIHLADAAKILGDVVGQNATVALKELSEALESGRAKALKGYAGTTIDLAAAFGDLAGKMTATEKAQAMYSLIMIHATKLQQDQTVAVDETADKIEKLEAKWKNLKQTVANAAKTIAVGIWDIFTGPVQYDADGAKLSGKKGESSKSNEISTYQKQIDSLKSVLQKRSDYNDSLKKGADTASKLAEEAKKINEELANNIKLNGLDDLDKKLEEINVKFEKLAKNPLIDKGLLSEDRLNQESAAIKDWYDKDIQKQIEAAKNYETQMKAVNDSILKAFYAMQHEQETTRHWRSGNQEISNSIPDMWGNTSGQAQAGLKLRYDEEIARVNAQIAEMDALYQKDTVNYQLAIERKKLLDQEYAANKKRREIETWENVAGIAASQFGQIAGLMDKGNKEQFNAWKAFAIAEAIVAGALTFMKMMASAPYPVNLALAGVSAGITAAQVGIIAGQQYQGRADGGTVNAGQTYWVGERGPELFTPGATGMITANDKIGGTVSIVQHNDFRNADPASEQRIKIAMKKTKEETMAAIYSSMQRGGQFAIASGRLK